MENFASNVFATTFTAIASTLSILFGPFLPSQQPPIEDKVGNIYLAASAGPVTVLYPNGAEGLIAGDTTTIKWQTSIAGFASIWLSEYKDGVYRNALQIADGVPVVIGDNNYSWQIPSSVPAAFPDNREVGSNYRILINMGNYPNYDYSDDNFKIGGSGTTTSTPSSTIPIAVDSDNSPDYKAIKISYPITPEKYPDLFIAGVGKGFYDGGGSPCIYGAEPDPTFCKPTTNNYSIYYDHCANSTQLNEAFVTGGRLSSFGIEAANGYVCANGVFVKISSSPYPSVSYYPYPTYTYPPYPSYTPYVSYTPSPTYEPPTASPRNIPPVAAFIKPQSIRAGRTLTFILRADDADGANSSLSYRFCLYGTEGKDREGCSLPNNIKFDGRSGKFSWRPTEDQAGIYYFTETVFDAHGATDQQIVLIKVVR